MDAFQILVIILSAFLAIFLILGIVVLIMFINLSFKIRRVAVKLNDIADNVRTTTETVRDTVADISRLASPAIIAKIVLKYVRNIIQKRRNNG